MICSSSVVAGVVAVRGNMGRKIGARCCKMVKYRDCCSAFVSTAGIGVAAMP